MPNIMWTQASIGLSYLYPQFQIEHTFSWAFALGLKRPSARAADTNIPHFGNFSSDPMDKVPELREQKIIEFERSMIWLWYEFIP